MSFYFFQCVDVWLFRDGKLFDVGIGHRAQSMFPPYPTVIQGAIRSHQLALQHININDKTKIQEAVGDTENYQNLRLRGPFLSYKENEKITPYYPLPADAVTIDPESLSVRPSNQPIPVPEGTLTNSGDLWILGLGDQPSKGLGNLWLTQNDLISYLERKEVKGISEQNLFNRENRVGISIDPLSGTTRPGALFEVEYIRPENKVGLLVEMEGYSWPQSGLLRLGGESRAASYTEVNANLAITTKPILNLPSRFKVYFATPTWFSDGWKPKDWKVFFDGEVILRAAALTRYQSIGGFDFSKKRHKPSRRFVPAGSVYYFECTGSAGIRSDLLQNALTEWGAEIGFGQYIISKEW